MSHTTEVSNIVFSDIAALRSAVAELNAKGVKCSLTQDTVPRAYFNNQNGLGKADHVLYLNESPYDVGFYKTADGKGYVARTDLHMGHVSKQLGAQPINGETREQAALGRLNRLYAVHAATRKAVSQGMTIKRQDNQDGSIRLTLGGIK